MWKNVNKLGTMLKWGAVALQASRHAENVQCEEEICNTNQMTFVENKHMDGTINDSWVKGELI